MPSLRLSGLLSTLAERLYAIAWGALASGVEADAALHEADAIDRIETAARKYEADGKTLLAERLRRRASLLTADDPGAQGAATLGRLASPDTDRPRLPSAEPPPPKPKRRRHSSEAGPAEAGQS